jgi:transcriptional regulator with GAF, ATPase, and Fis domain
MQFSAPDAPARITPINAPIRTLADAERAHITKTLRETNWVIGGRRGAAAQLGLPRTSLIARMQRLGMSGVHSTPNLRVMEAVAG